MQLEYGRMQLEEAPSMVASSTPILFTVLKIYIQGKGPITSAETSTKRSLRARVCEARQHFKDTFGESTKVPSTDIIEKILAHFLITRDYTEQLSKNFS